MTTRGQSKQTAVASSCVAASQRCSFGNAGTQQSCSLRTSKIDRERERERERGGERGKLPENGTLNR